MNNKLLIATHDSASGEKAGSLLSWLVIPFARTQSKNIKGQYEAGCRMFDIRIKYINNSWRCAHGLFYTKRYASDILHEINSFKENCYVCLTYEGKLSSITKEDFLLFYSWAKSAFPNIYWGPVAAKYADNDTKVDWINLKPAEKWFKNEQEFLPLDGKHWQTYIPIPWLWNKLYTRKHNFNNEYFLFVDFL